MYLDNELLELVSNFDPASCGDSKTKGKMTEFAKATKILAWMKNTRVSIKFTCTLS